MVPRLGGTSNSATFPDRLTETYQPGHASAAPIDRHGFPFGASDSRQRIRASPATVRHLGGRQREGMVVREGGPNPAPCASRMATSRMTRMRYFSPSLGCWPPMAPSPGIRVRGWMFQSLSRTGPEMTARPSKVQTSSPWSCCGRILCDPSITSSPATRITAWSARTGPSTLLR